MIVVNRFLFFNQVIVFEWTYIKTTKQINWSDNRQKSSPHMKIVRSPKTMRDREVRRRSPFRASGPSSPAPPPGGPPWLLCLLRLLWTLVIVTVIVIVINSNSDSNSNSKSNSNSNSNSNRPTLEGPPPGAAARRRASPDMVESHVYKALLKELRRKP